MGKILVTLFSLILLSYAKISSAEIGVTSGEILIGQSAGLSGPAAAQINDLTDGAKAHFKEINEGGGIFGRKIRLISYDDQIKKDLTIENTKKLLEIDKVFALFLYRATPNIEAILPLVADNHIPLIGPSSGAKSMYDIKNKYVFPVRASYEQEVSAIIKHFSTVGIKNLALMYEDAAFGKEVQAATDKYAQKFKVNLVAQSPYKRGTEDVDQAVKEFSQKSPGGIIVVGAANGISAFIKKYAQTGNHAQIMTLSNLGSDSFVKALGEYSLGVGISQVTPWPFSATTKLTQDYLKAINVAGYKPSFLGMEGYLAARVLTESIKKTGKTLTRDKLIATLNSFGKFNLDGVILEYSESTKLASTYVDLTVIGPNGKFLH